MTAHPLSPCHPPHPHSHSRHHAHHPARGRGAVARKAALNTLMCLAGCSIGDMATILFFQLTGIPWPTLAIMALGISNGILTSVAMETLLLCRQMPAILAFRTAVGMSLMSMLAMELAENSLDVWLTGGAQLIWWVLPIMWGAGFLAAFPYNYWRLKKFGKACH